VLFPETSLESCVVHPRSGKNWQTYVESPSSRSSRNTSERKWV